MLQFDRQNRRDRRPIEIFRPPGLQARLKQSADACRKKHDQSDRKPSHA